MILDSRSFIITKGYSGSSKFKFWTEGMQEGAIFHVEMELKPTGSNRGKIYAPEITIVLHDRLIDNTFTDSINAIQNRLAQIEYKSF